MRNFATTLQVDCVQEVGLCVKAAHVTKVPDLSCGNIHETPFVPAKKTGKCDVLLEMEDYIKQP